MKTIPTIFLVFMSFTLIGQIKLHENQKGASN